VRRAIHLRVRQGRRQSADRPVSRGRYRVARCALLRTQGPAADDAGAVRVRRRFGAIARRAALCNRGAEQQVIAASGLTRRFGTRVVVDHATFDVGRGEIVALLGPNGAGKTTTLRMLAGLIAPNSGSIAIGGVPLTRATGGRLRAQIGFLTETPGLWDRLTV